MKMEHRLSALLQLHLHARLNTWLQWIGQIQQSHFTNVFPLRWAARTSQISGWVITTQCRLYSNISHISLLYKTWRYSNKSPQCRLMEHVLKEIVFYVQKLITACTVFIDTLLVRDKPIRTSASVKRVYCKTKRGFGAIVIEESENVYQQQSLKSNQLLMYVCADIWLFICIWYTYI